MEKLGQVPCYEGPVPFGWDRYSQNTFICEEHLIGSKYVKKECENRHPRICRHFLKGSCCREILVFFLNEDKSKVIASNERETQSEKDKSESFQLNKINVFNEECANCKCCKAKNTFYLGL